MNKPIFSIKDGNEESDREKVIVAIACAIWSAAKKGAGDVQNIRARLMRDATAYGVSADCAELLNGICDIVIGKQNQEPVGK
jgi:hypothetical protein